MAEKKFFLTAAIDFGTTYSGYAFQLTSDYEPKDPTKKILCPQSWNEGTTKLTSMKTPTCLLLDRNKDIDSFGYVAEDKYAELCMDGDNKSWYFFRRFKMELHDTKGLKKTTMLTDETGKQLQALTVFSKSIECLTQHLFQMLADQKINVNKSAIKWVLTVPAIWDDTAKGFMKKAAKWAGIPKENLTIALEPEAASLFCQYLPVERFNMGGKSGFGDAKPGTTYMILDLGGGTADITVHEKISTGKLKEVHRASGGPWGGTAVDGAFIQLLSQTVGGPVFKAFMNDHRYDYIELMREFEMVKRNVSADTKDLVKIKLPVSLNETCIAMVKKDFLTLVKQAKKDKQISFAGDKSKFDPEVIRNLFRKVTDKIVAHMKKILDDTPQGKKVSLILMVGGFSESAFVQDVIKKEFHEKKGRKVLIPRDAGICVVQGAVVYGKQPGNIASRILKVTYGAKLSLPFNPKIHDKKKKYDCDGTERCADIFGEFIHADTEVQADQVLNETYHTVRPYQGDTTLVIYTSNQNRTNYVDESGCTKLGELVVKIPNPSEEIRDIAVEYIFGDTELHVRAFEAKDKIPCKASLKLLA
ncbi:hypothetical protein ACF0H5_006171 [Mactra antiquata]